MKKGVLRNLAKFTGKHLCQRWTKNGKISRTHKMSHFFNDEVTFESKRAGVFCRRDNKVDPFF